MNRNDFIVNEKASRDTIDVKRVYILMASDHAAGVLLSQIVYWHLPDKEGNPTRLTVKRDNHLWLAKKRDDWWDEICMLPKQFDRAIKELENRELVKTELFRFGGSPTKHIRLNWDMFLRVYEAIINDDKPSFNPDNPEGGKWIFPIREYGNSRSGNMETPDQGISQTPRKPTPAGVPTLVEEGPEITTEITTENHPVTPVINTPGVEVEKNDDDDENKTKMLNNPDSNLLSGPVEINDSYYTNIEAKLSELHIRNQISSIEFKKIKAMKESNIPLKLIIKVMDDVFRNAKGKRIKSFNYFADAIWEAFNTTPKNRGSPAQTRELLQKMKEARDG